jgi:hypothetical protein
VKRIVERELLDELPPDDARAIRSRGDLRRLNWLMRHVAIFRTALTARQEQAPQVIAEIGSGDGTLMVSLARQLHFRWPRVHVVLVDRQKVVGEETLQSFGKLGWRAEAVTADVFDWLASAKKVDVLLANLFLHHFANETLAVLLRSLAQKTNLFLACETRRDWPSLAVGRLLGLMGCNSVTRHDALISMKAGFLGNELSALWPKEGGWELHERRATVFTHLFIAGRKR